MDAPNRLCSDFCRDIKEGGMFLTDGFETFTPIFLSCSDKRSFCFNVDMLKRVE